MADFVYVPFWQVFNRIWLASSEVFDRAWLTSFEILMVVADFVCVPSWQMFNRTWLTSSDVFHRVWLISPVFSHGRCSTGYGWLHLRCLTGCG